ncbi:hypothetical protein PMAYCL1PPCAC_28190, partial [Pristionchus mayeri]
SSAMDKPRSRISVSQSLAASRRPTSRICPRDGAPPRHSHRASTHSTPTASLSARSSSRSSPSAV